MKRPSEQTRKLAAPDPLWVVSIRWARHDAALAVAVVLGLGALWWGYVELGAHSAVAKSTGRIVAIRWLPSTPVDSAHVWVEDVRAVASPVLFALPTPLGFSRSHLVWDAPTLPVPDDRGTPPLPSSAWPTQALARLDAPTLAETVRFARRLDRIPATDTTQEAAMIAATGSVLVVVWERADGKTRTLTLPVEAGSVWVSEGPWEARARVRLDPDGWPDHILLENTGAGRNRETMLMQMLRQMNFGASPTRDGLLHVRYEGPVAGNTR